MGGESWAGALWPRGDPGRGGQPRLQPSALPTPSQAPPAAPLGPLPREAAMKGGGRPTRPSLPAGVPGALPAASLLRRAWLGRLGGTRPAHCRAVYPTLQGGPHRVMAVLEFAVMWAFLSVGFTLLRTTSVQVTSKFWGQLFCFCFLLRPCHGLQICCNFLFLLRRGCFPPSRPQGERPRQGVAGRGGGGRGHQSSWQDAGRRGGRGAVSAEQVAARLSGRAAAPGTSALRAWPQGHGGCWGTGQGVWAARGPAASSGPASAERRYA